MIGTQVRQIPAAEVESILPTLVELLCEAVDSGASLGFLPPLGAEECANYWRGLRRELDAGSRLLFGASRGDRLVGAVQLSLPPWPNARHRAEVQKLFVASVLKGQGIGRSLMDAIHDEARRRGRSLFLLTTRRGDPAVKFYQRLGYREVGMIPGYSLGPAGEYYDNLAMCRNFQEPPA